MKRIVHGAILFIFVSILSSCSLHADSERITNVSAFDEQGHYTCQYNGIEREFILFIPENVPENAPLLMMLHGYSGNAKSFAEETKMNETADEYGYLVAYPQGLPDPTDKTSSLGWNSGLKKTGNDDVGFLTALAQYLQKTYHVPSNETFAVGFSNGAFMIHRLANEAPETFRAVASVAGFMTASVWEERKEKTSIGFLQINGTKDDVVPQRSNKYQTNSSTPVIEDVMAYWRDANDLEISDEWKLAEQTTAYCYSSQTNSNRVCHIVIENGRHAWPEEQYAGFQTNIVILDFFDHFREN